MSNRTKHVHDVGGVKVLLWGSAEYAQAIETLRNQGEDVSRKYYIILSPDPITIEKRQEIRDWYRSYVNDLLEKGENPKKSIRKRARKTLNEIGWVVEWD